VIPEERLATFTPTRLTEPWQNRLGGDLTEPGAGALVAEDESGVVAFAGFVSAAAPDGDGPRAVELDTFYSLPEVWGSGVNGVLADAVHTAMSVGPLDRAFLWVLESNVRARRFYAARGWADTGTVKEQGLFGGAVVLTAVLYRRPL
jgi:ribosomal protein S18 acetylase RimI-like enzyme